MAFLGVEGTWKNWVLWACGQDIHPPQQPGIPTLLPSATVQRLKVPKGRGNPWFLLPPYWDESEDIEAQRGAGGRAHPRPYSKVPAELDLESRSPASQPNPSVMHPRVEGDLELVGEQSWVLGRMLRPW